jgi:hypothetical protein
VVGFTLIPLIYLLGHFLKGLRNAEIYTVLILYVSCWLFYNAYQVWKDEILLTVNEEFPKNLIFHMILLNPFIYVVELSTLNEELNKKIVGTHYWIIILHSFV